MWATLEQNGADKDKIIAVFVIATRRVPFLCLPTVHSIAYYLSTEGVTFKQYEFGLSAYPAFAQVAEPGRYPRSTRLDKDLGTLVGLDYLDVKTSDVPKFVLGEALDKDEELKQTYLSIFDGIREISADELGEKLSYVLKMMKEKPEAFYSLCYNRYVSKL
jgi:hypothetical protein